MAALHRCQQRRSAVLGISSTHTQHRLNVTLARVAMAPGTSSVPGGEALGSPRLTAAPAQAPWSRTRTRCTRQWCRPAHITPPNLASTTIHTPAFGQHTGACSRTTAIHRPLLSTRNSLSLLTNIVLFTFARAASSASTMDSCLPATATCSAREPSYRHAVHTHEDNREGGAQTPAS